MICWLFFIVAVDVDLCLEPVWHRRLLQEPWRCLWGDRAMRCCVSECLINYYCLILISLVTCYQWILLESYVLVWNCVLGFHSGLQSSCAALYYQASFSFIAPFKAWCWFFLLKLSKLNRYSSIIRIQSSSQIPEMNFMSSKLRPEFASRNFQMAMEHCVISLNVMCVSRYVEHCG